MMNTIGLALISLISLNSVSGHMEVRSPPPRDSKFNKNTQTQNINYNLLAPVDKYGCNQFTQTAPVATYKAGGSIQFSFAGTATHNGGSCQFGLSYDGQNFITLKDVIGDCLIGAESYDVPIPKDAPNGNAIAGWFWINKTGNREFYMNCIDIAIEGGSDKKELSGRSISIANIEGRTTIPEGEGGISQTEDLYNSAKTITITQGGSSYPTKVDPKDNKQAEDKKEYQTVAPTTTQAPKPTQTATQAPKPKPTSTNNGSYNPRDKPLVEPMMCDNGPPFCEDDVTLSQCSENKVFRIFCDENTHCVKSGDNLNCLPLSYH
ncbi:hypothetical protein CONCODRAFT_77581 [Conidiobolus coronatus NRRL 28638]|uniref:Lytic polysaccharide monooxygenase n=1 Tax=Conidiobolus coronatus (strain ATCC 28846 / CBS 209.66 / NRRL 28638) TaxID=796925 RepID=A0A137PDE0_CONC2|nr:hypothetical protein CONCODRAFT_77581 [Conidiobolus coronatus NRRL 28638]|eukprot:KXN72951.1 hypothetical protein CONCODRAFT_77581 [Conidiobolus coronatus NRRL 28638]